MVRNLTLTGIIAAFSFPASADILGADAHAAFWGSDIAGDYTHNSQTRSLDEELGLDREEGYFISTKIEHPVPVLPNLRLQYSSSTQKGTKNVSAYGVSGKAETELDIEMVDVTAYYEVLDNVVSLDLGLTARSLDSVMNIKSETDHEEIDVRGVLPMGYASASVSLPFTGSRIGAEINGVAHDDDSIVDGIAYVEYGVGPAVIRGGYRQFQIDFEDDGDAIDASQDGPFMSVGIDL